MATLTIKNLPDNIYAALKQTAARHRRSINSEAIVHLERSLVEVQPDTAEILGRIRKLRENTANIYLTDTDLAKAKNEGRA